MNTHKALTLAVQHARVVDEIERTAPAVETGYLDRALARMRLGVRVEFVAPWNHFIVHRPWGGAREHFDRNAAVADYVDVCDIMFSDSAASASPGAAATSPDVTAALAASGDLSSGPIA